MYEENLGAEILEVPEDVQEMLDWARNKGVKWPKIVYPVKFPPGYIGSIATETIFPGESIITAPNAALFTSKVASQSDLQEIFLANSDLFDPSSAFYDDLVLSSFIISEKFKGPASEWAAFLKYQPKCPSNTQDWTTEELQELQDPDLLYDSVKSMEYHLESWKKWKSVLEKYPERFTSEMLELSEYTWAIRLIGTRTFGKFAPYVTFFPVGELLNHDNVQSFYTYLPPGEVADSSKRYSGIVNDEDHDGMIYEAIPTIEIPNESLAYLSFILNDGIDDNVYGEIKEKCAKIDVEEAEQEEINKVYRPPDIDLTESPEKEMRIVTGPDETYAKGSEVYMSYGRYSNRQLLSVYGFSLKVNKFNFAIVKFPVTSLVSTAELGEKMRLEEFSPDQSVCFKLKERVICLKLLKVLRKLWWRNGHPTSSFFSPKLPELESQILTHSIKLLTENLDYFPTTYEEDTNLLQTSLPLRKYFAVTHRSQLKKIIKNQISYLQAAHKVVSEILSGLPISSAKSENIPDENLGLALRGYFEEF